MTTDLRALVAGARENLGLRAGLPWQIAAPTIAQRLALVGGTIWVSRFAAVGVTGRRLGDEARMQRQEFGVIGLIVGLDSARYST